MVTFENIETDRKPYIRGVLSINDAVLEKEKLKSIALVQQPRLGKLLSASHRLTFTTPFFRHHLVHSRLHPCYKHIATLAMAGGSTLLPRLFA